MVERTERRFVRENASERFLQSVEFNDPNSPIRSDLMVQCSMCCTNIHWSMSQLSGFACDKSRNAVFGW
ncbi:hypothetical protein RISK_000572 [Rhodopirellula islandica]|uniref:Uncharacterized protein n=1 Tax=Rhodopirellula islandica TaxID=595434 RepID=A0A0J1EPT9_RHOIS|nr:hypothetical protein RISK_000572 [Rhodopirellula islandica]